ncbi:MAG TPA: NrfD/PsrC family molybdoenzyme membrane anchor subunit, partial [Gammaproteobacteria bacterium]|nr:NrfD/PsrC family molybdoenzyme membrane anchor subunit [Gammaproteobacteria bacterium]
MKQLDFREIDGGKPFYMLVGFIGLFILAGLGAAYYMEHNGHYVTGMSNQIVWGTPHVFAVFLIVAASGALNVASISSVFGKTAYKPLARLSGLLAITLLVGGLAVLVLDLGRPDRLIVAMTYYNFKSIFAWNIMLYTGFMGVVAVYLWMMMERKMNTFTKPAGLAAFLWRLILTTGTGSIFGFLVAREAYDTALLAPMFIIMSFSFGLAIFILVLMGMYRWADRPLGDAILYRLKNLLGVFVAAVLYFVVVYHLTNLYITENHGIERFILLDGGVYTQLFWIVQIGLGSLLPLVLLYLPATGKSRGWIGISSLLVIIGGLAQVYVLLIG